MIDKERLVRDIAFMIANRENSASMGVGLKPDNPKVQKYLLLAKEILTLVQCYYEL